ncbi:SNARE-binding exocyst subunit S6 [Cyanidiococcus yangmingshanensis]|uniref:SNARE-binding exocyst subunit S6 n=1 Tax=Cyanidiococcus yangmingshanensis TaxID=2690220 RepID=A0A7J7IL35_9RHOD|nr:SNARE-binding exocyst subunit S6 [Cyanidiococcus yangmingshanensis]
MTGFVRRLLDSRLSAPQTLSTTGTRLMAGSANELPVMGAMPIQRTGDANTQFSPAESIETSEEPEVEPQLVTRVQALCDLLVADVQFVAEHVRPLFDENTAVGHWYALETNQLLNAFLWSVIARASLIPGKDILNLLMWITKYHERIQQLFPAPSTDSLSWNGAVVWAREQQEALLHGLETPARRLIEGYAARALEMMRRWIRNCIKVDIEGPVDVRDDDETLYTQAPLDVFRIVNDEITIVREHAQLRNPRFVQCISDACCAALLDYRTWSLDALEGIESEDGALERFCATVNNHRRCQSLAEQFAIRCHTILDEIVYGLVDWRRESSSTPTTTDATLETPMTKQDAPGSSHPLGGAIDAATYALSVDRLAAEFAVSAEFAATLVCNVIFQDMDEAPGLWPRLYTPAWVLGEEEIASSVVATVDDFFQDIDGYLRHEMDKAAVATECAIRIADRYASALANHLLATSAVVSPTLSTQADGDPSDSACAPSTKAKSRSNIAQRITGGGSSRLLRALGTSRDGNLSGRLGSVANPLAFDRRIVDRLRDDYAILAEHFLHARRGGSRARVARALSAMDALADMLAAAVAANTDALVTSYGNLLGCKAQSSGATIMAAQHGRELIGFADSCSRAACQFGGLARCTGRLSSGLVRSWTNPVGGRVGSSDAGLLLLMARAAAPVQEAAAARILPPAMSWCVVQQVAGDHQGSIDGHTHIPTRSCGRSKYSLTSDREMNSSRQFRVRGEVSLAAWRQRRSADLPSRQHRAIDRTGRGYARCYLDETRPTMMSTLGIELLCTQREHNASTLDDDRDDITLATNCS